MDAYTGFAEVYDLFMDNIPYENWSRYLTGLLREYGIEDGLVLDLGCGTGTLTRLLADAGYDMTGIDYSEEMLEIAMEKKAEDAILAEEAGVLIEEDPDREAISGEAELALGRRASILYLCQDMREFELYGTIRAVVSICDSMNYITEYEDLVEVFRLVNNYLDPKGVFIFDLNTLYKYRELLGEQTIAENREEGSFIWENYFDEESRINEYDLTLYIKEDQGLYRRYEENHYQRAYELEEVKTALREAGMEFITAYDAFTRNAPKEDSERIYVIAREQGKAPRTDR